MSSVNFTPSSAVGASFFNKVKDAAASGNRIDQVELDQLSKDLAEIDKPDSGIAADDLKNAKELLANLKNFTESEFDPNSGIVFADKNGNQTVDQGDMLSFDFSKVKAVETVAPAPEDTQPKTETATLPDEKTQRDEFKDDLGTPGNVAQSNKLMEFYTGPNGDGGYIGNNITMISNQQAKLKGAVDMREAKLVGLRDTLGKTSSPEAKAKLQSSIDAIGKEIEQIRAQNDKLTANKAALEAFRTQLSGLKGKPKEMAEAAQRFVMEHGGDDLKANLKDFNYKAPKGKEDGVDGEFGFRSHAATKVALTRMQESEPIPEDALKGADGAIAEADTLQKAADEAQKAADAKKAEETKQADAKKAEDLKLAGRIKQEISREKPDIKALRELVTKPNLKEALKADPSLGKDIVAKAEKLIDQSDSDKDVLTKLFGAVTANGDLETGRDLVKAICCGNDDSDNMMRILIKDQQVGLHAVLDKYPDQSGNIARELYTGDFETSDKAALRNLYSMSNDAGKAGIVKYGLGEQSKNYLNCLHEGWTKHMRPEDADKYGSMYGNISSYSDKSRLGKDFKAAPPATQIALLNYYGKDDDEEGVVAMLRETSPKALATLLEAPGGMAAVETAIQALKGPNSEEKQTLKDFAAKLQAMLDKPEYESLKEKLRTTLNVTNIYTHS